MSINLDLLTAAGGLTTGHPVIIVDGIAFPVGVQGSGGGGGGDLPSVSFTAKDLKKGATALNTLGAVVAGTMPETQITVLGAVVSATSGYVSSGAIATIPDATYSMSVKDSERKVEVSVTSGGYMATGETSSLSLPSPTFSSTTGTTVSASSATVKKTVSSGGYLKKGDTVSVDIARGSATLSGNVFKVSSGYHLSTSVTMLGADVAVAGANVNVLSAGYARVGTLATIPSAVVNVSGAQVTVTSGGYVSSGAIATIPSAEITSTTTAIRIGAGYVSSAVEFPVSYNGEAQYGVVDDNGNFQPLDMTVSPPVNSGTALEATYRTIATGLPYPDGEEVTPGGGGGGSFAKVTKFIAPHDAFTAVESINVSGFGEVETWDGTEDYSAWNGTYQVTPETAGETSTEKRIYKHPTEKKYLYRMYCNDNMDYYWVFNTSTSSDYVYDADFYADELKSGTWNNYEYEVSVNLTITQNNVNYPKQELVLEGKLASYSEEKQIIVVGDTLQSFTAYTQEPKERYCYACSGTALIGHPIATPEVAAVPTDFKSNEDAAERGYIIDQSHGESYYPEAYVVFNMNETESDYAWWSGNIGVSESKPTWFSIELPQAIVPTGFFIMNEVYTSENFESAKFQGLNDAGEWDDLYVINDSPDTTAYKQKHEVQTETAYKKFRMYFTASHASGVSVQCFMIYKAEYIEE